MHDPVVNALPRQRSGFRVGKQRINQNMIHLLKQPQGGLFSQVGFFEGSFGKAIIVEILHEFRRNRRETLISVEVALVEDRSRGELIRTAGIICVRVSFQSQKLPFESVFQISLCLGMVLVCQLNSGYKTQNVDSQN
jgi:hypothetical protein